MTRIGIVGCGRILAAHLRGYRLLREAGVDDFRITALCSRKADDAQMYIRRGGSHPQRPAVSDVPGDPLAVGDEYLSDFQDQVEVKVYTDYREMIGGGEIDAVNDLTTHAMHHQIAGVAFQHGKHLLTQKPLAVTVSAGRQMCLDAEARTLVFGIFENARYRPEARHFRWLLDSGRAGKLQMVLFGNVGTWWAPDRIVAGTPWRHRLVEGGGISLDLGVHQFHLIRHIAGAVKSVEGRTVVVEPTRVTVDARGNVVEKIDCDGDDTFYASFEAEGGVSGNLFGSWAGHGGSTVVGEGTVFYCQRGRVSGNRISFDDGPPVELSQMYDEACEQKRREKEFFKRPRWNSHRPLATSDSSTTPTATPSSYP